jgi:hypothetical protein
MSPVDVLRNTSSFSANAGTVRLVGMNGGFIVTYPRCDRPTLRTISDYQQAIRVSYPGWVTLFDFKPPRKECTLQVFPLDELPTRFLWGARQAWTAMK